MRKIIFAILSFLLVTTLVAVVPFTPVAANPDSSSPPPAPPPAQQEVAQKIIEDILSELNQAKGSTNNEGILDQIDAIIKGVKHLGWLELTGDEEGALKLKRELAGQLEGLINELPAATTNVTAAAAPASNSLYDELLKIRGKIERLIDSETPLEEVPTPQPTISRLPETERLIVYSAKFLCGPAFGNEGVQRGSYSTAINVHNPHNGTVYLYKKAVIANREDDPRGKISAFRKVILKPDEAIEIDCVDIDSLLGYQQDLTRLSAPSQQAATGLTALSPETETGLTTATMPTTIRSVDSLIQFLKGFVVIYSTAPLDVVAVYTASNSVGFSLDVEYLSPSTTATLPITPPPEEARCPDGCKCLTYREAEEEGYTAWCQGEIKICGYDEQQNEKYCFEEPTEEDRCPDTCRCLTEVEAKRLGYSDWCQGEKIICGYDEQQNEKYCYEVPTEEEECPQGCRCLTEAEAREDGYTWCQEKRTECGIDATTGATKYCFEKYTCPRGCECLSESEADEQDFSLCDGIEIQCGTDAAGNTLYCYEMPTEEVTCPDGCICLSPEEAAKEKLRVCAEESGICGLTVTGAPKYCYEEPAEEEEECPPECRCLTELEARRLGYTWCGGKRIPCDYVPGGPTKWCYEEAVPGRITIEPTQDSNPVGSTHTVTIYVSDTYGNPMPNLTVGISISGAHSIGPAKITTNASGKATYDYPGKNVGTDVIVATAGSLSATAYKDWYRR